MRVRILAVGKLETRVMAGKVASAELHFEPTDGVLSGLKLAGFDVWERRGGGLNVTFPARSYAVNGERRTFALLRPIDGNAVQPGASFAIRDAILAAYAEFQKADAAGVVCAQSTNGLPAGTQA